MDMEDIVGLGAAVNRIAELGTEATKLDVIKIEPPSTAKGLVPFPVAFSHQTGNIDSLAQLAEAWREHPARRKGTATVNTLASLSALVKRHMTADSVVFCATSWPSPSITAVINYHELAANGKAQFGDHRINYPFPLTDEFKAWAEQDGKAMKQADFASFIEERVAELALATSQEETEFGQLFQTKMANPGEMLALSRGLEIHVAGTVKQNVRLQSGEGSIMFEEEHRDSNNQPVVVPGLFMISVPAFLDGEPVRLPARLRYRVSGGSIAWFYQLYRWKELLRDRVISDVRTVGNDTGLPVYEGSPER